MKCRESQPVMRTMMVRALSFSAVAAMMVNQALTPVLAGDYRVAAPVAADGQMNARFLALGIGKSIVIDLPRDIKDVLVADPKIANAVVRSSQRAYIIGAAVGQTNIVFFDAAGQQIAAYDIAVKRDLNGLRAALKSTLPNADIQIEGIGDGVILTGSAANPIEAQQAGEPAARLAGGAEKVVNSIAVRGRDQVMLKVTVAEVARNIIKQLGIDLSGTLNYGTAVVNFNNSNPFTALGRPLVAGNAVTAAFGSSVSATLRAMAKAGVVRTLAEPNLTALSGQEAKFLAGGEYPIPVSSKDGISVEYKPFGVELNFTPTVVDGDLINLQINAAVSSIDTTTSVTQSGFSVNAFKRRETSTTVEMRDGESFAIAGLLQDDFRDLNGQVPWLGDIPIIGALFRSAEYQRAQSELVIIVTPHLVTPTRGEALALPTDRVRIPTERELFLFGKTAGGKGPAGEVARQDFSGSYGYVME